MIIILAENILTRFFLVEYTSVVNFNRSLPHQETFQIPKVHMKTYRSLLFLNGSISEMFPLL